MQYLVVRLGCAFHEVAAGEVKEKNEGQSEIDAALQQLAKDWSVQGKKKSRICASGRQKDSSPRLVAVLVVELFGRFRAKGGWPSSRNPHPSRGRAEGSPVSGSQGTRRQQTTLPTRRDDKGEDDKVITHTRA